MVLAANAVLRYFLISMNPCGGVAGFLSGLFPHLCVLCVKNFTLVLDFTTQRTPREIFLHVIFMKIIFMFRVSLAIL